MKRMFIAAMAIAALVSCSKDDDGGVAIDSKNKSIEITIANGTGASRASGDGVSAGVTHAGVGNEANQMASAEATELYVLFVDNQGKIAEVRPLVNTGDASNEQHSISGEYVAGTTGVQSTYIWHNVPWDIVNVAVVRLDEAKDATYYGTKSKGQQLKTIADLATNEALNLDRGLGEIVLYGVDPDGLTDMNVTHEVDGVSYHYWRAEVTVAPALARFEINNIQCLDLGDKNKDEDPTTYGFDELVVNSLIWNGKYTIDGTIGTMYGSYNNTTSDRNTMKEGTRNNFVKPAADEDGTANVWSWNVTPQAFSGLTVNMTGAAYDYEIATAGQSLPLTVTGLATTENATTGDVTEFKAENIYQLNLKFKEGNLKDDDKLCLQVTVTINPWTINTVYPVFDTNNNNSK